MADLFETHNGTVYRNGVPQFQVPPMEELAPNPRYVPPPGQQAPVTPTKKTNIKRKRLPASSTTPSTAKTKAPGRSGSTPTRSTAGSRSRQAAQKPVPNRTPRPLPASSAQPRDRLGRFASYAGRALWGATKATAVGTGRAVAGTVKFAQRTHKTIKRSQAQAKRERNIELREQAVKVAEREQKLGIRKKKVIRRRKR